MAVAVYASTTREWFDAHVSMRHTDVAFWQPTPAEPHHIVSGAHWYFKELHAPNILGFGRFKNWETLSPSNLFDRYGSQTGYTSQAALDAALKKLSRGNSAPFLIGNVVLTHFTAFNPVIPLESVGLKNLHVRFAYLEEFDPITLRFRHLEEGTPSQSKFQLSDLSQAERELRKVKSRSKQGQFRDMLLNIYGTRCAISGPQPSEVLEAAHIQVYVNAQSNHPANGLLFRSDVHALFDCGIFFVDEHYVVRFDEAWISANPQYSQFHMKPLVVRNSSGIAPSTLALKFQKDHVFDRFQSKRAKTSAEL